MFHGNGNLEEGNFHPEASLKGKCPEVHSKRKQLANGPVQKCQSARSRRRAAHTGPPHGSQAGCSAQPAQPPCTAQPSGRPKRRPRVTKGRLLCSSLHKRPKRPASSLNSTLVTLTILFEPWTRNHVRAAFGDPA